MDAGDRAFVAGLRSTPHPSCPFAFHTAQSPPSIADLISSVAQRALGSFTVTRWAQDTCGWVSDIDRTGCLAFLSRKLRESGGRYSNRLLTILHRRLCISDDPEFWKLFGKHKGGPEGIVGGIDLSCKLAGMISPHTPLTSDGDEHSRLKRFYMRTNFNVDTVNRNAPGIYPIAQRYVRHVFGSGACRFNASEAIRQGVSRLVTLFLLAPPGSKAFDKIYPLLFQNDGSPNPEWNPVPHAVKTRSRKVSEEMLLRPGYYGERVSSAVRGAICWLWGKEKVNDELEASNRVLQQTASTLVQKSREAQALFLALDAVDRENLTRGELEWMIESGEFTDAQLMGTALLDLGIGQGTTSIAIEACLRNLALYPDWQRILYDKLQEGEEEWKKTFYKVLAETLRLDSPVPMQTRELTRTADFNGMSIPAGTTLVMPNFLLNRDALRFTDPNTFNPDRFSNIEHFSESGLSIFGQYPHNCAGKWVARALISGFMKAVISSYTVRFADVGGDGGIRPMGGALLRFSDDLYLEFVLRAD